MFSLTVSARRSTTVPLARQHVLGAQLVPELERLARLVGVEDELDEPGAVAQVDEDEPAVVAAAVDPAGDPDLGADAVGQHLAAPGVAVVVGPQGREFARLIAGRQCVGAQSAER